MKIGPTQKAILRYMAEHPMDGYNTTAYGLADKVAEATGGGMQTVYQALHKLVRNYVVLQQTKPHSRIKDFIINWNCHSLPKEIVELAPKSVQDAVEQTNEKLRTGEYLSVDPFGAGITKKADVDDTDVTDITDDDSDIKEPETKPEPVQVQEVVATENAVVVEPTVVKTADGKSISINLTINLNL